MPFELEVHSPIQLTRALLPAMIARRGGTLLVTSGASEHRVQPYLANVGVALGAQRAYARQLAGELAGTGVYAGLWRMYTERDTAEVEVGFTA
ncbi:hypothetical protein [Nocardia lasii]|uniref:Uncharacterized protein n=1 Tax=Nocardia lasii TaxID=1616107 RepID=A0ABW1JRQ0_9NOCA